MPVLTAPLATIQSSTAVYRGLPPPSGCALLVGLHHKKENPAQGRVLLFVDSATFDRVLRSKTVPNYLPGSSTLMVKMSSSWVEPFSGKGFTLRVSDQSGCASFSLLMQSPL